MYINVYVYQDYLIIKVYQELYLASLFTALMQGIKITLVIKFNYSQVVDGLRVWMIIYLKLQFILILTIQFHSKPVVYNIIVVFVLNSREIYIYTDVCWTLHQNSASDREGKKVFGPYEKWLRVHSNPPPHLSIEMYGIT